MLIGYNNDVQYRGKTFHIQTEDRGMTHKCIETQIFHGGAILDTRIVPYDDLVDEESDEFALKRKIKTRMQQAHRELYRNLADGSYDQYAGLEPAGEKANLTEAVDEFMPSQDRVPDKARLIEEGEAPDDEESEALGGKHMDLSALKAKLARLNPATPDDEDEAEEIDDLDELASLADETPATLSLPSVFELGRPRLQRPAAPTVQLRPTGARAWMGCEAPTEDLSITALVEAYLKKAK